MQARTALVTGASSGIGLATTQALLARGYNVVATSRTVSRTPHLKASPQLVVIDGDVGEAATAERVTAAARARFGGLDLLVNNAGTFMAKPFTAYTPQDYAQLLATNLAGFFHMTQ